MWKYPDIPDNYHPLGPSVHLHKRFPPAKRYTSSLHLCYVEWGQNDFKKYQGFMWNCSENLSELSEFYIHITEAKTEG